MGDVVDFPGPTKVDLPTKTVIEAAEKAELETVIIVGWDKEDELYVAANKSKTGDLLLLLELAKKILLRG